MSGRLNKNNFLLWYGAFAEAPFNAVAVNDDASFPYNAQKIDIAILANDYATFGIDLNTIVVTQQDNINQPATWNPTSQLLTYYLPAGAGAGQRTIKYKWFDVNGNPSNEATVNITVTLRPTAWRGYGSPQCQVEFPSGEKTGMALYFQLEKYYTDDQSAVQPPELKDNSSSDPDYIPPFEDMENCNPNPDPEFMTRNFAFAINKDVCFGGGSGPSQYYLAYTTSNYFIGQLIYTDRALLNTAPTGFYFDGTYVLRAYQGRIINISNC